LPVAESPWEHSLGTQADRKLIDAVIGNGGTLIVRRQKI